MEPQSGKHVTAYRLFLLFLIAAGCLFRVYVCFHFNPVDYLYSDPLRHWENGMSFPRGGYAGAADPTAQSPSEWTASGL